MSQSAETLHYMEDSAGDGSRSHRINHSNPPSGMNSGVDLPLWTLKENWGGRSRFWWLYYAPNGVVLAMLVCLVLRGTGTLSGPEGGFENDYLVVLQGVFLMTILLMIVIYVDFKSLRDIGYLKIFLKAQQMVLFPPLSISISNSAILIYLGLNNNFFHYTSSHTFLLIVSSFLLILLTLLSISWSIIIYHHYTSKKGPDTLQALGVYDSDQITSTSGSFGSFNSVQLAQHIPEEFIVLFESQKQRIQHLSRQLLILTEKLKHCDNNTSIKLDEGKHE